MVIAKFATTTKHSAIEGKIQKHLVYYYNLDMIISIGYRVSSNNGGIGDGSVFNLFVKKELLQNLKNYWVDLKRKLIDEGSELHEKIVQVINIIFKKR